MHIFHNIDNASSEMFGYGRTNFLLPFKKIIEILTFNPSTHEIDSELVRKDSILFSNKRMCQFTTYNFECSNLFLHLKLDGFGFIDDSHSKLDIAL